MAHGTTPASHEPMPAGHAGDPDDARDQGLGMRFARYRYRLTVTFAGSNSVTLPSVGRHPGR